MGAGCSRSSPVCFMKPRVLFCTQTAVAFGGMNLWMSRLCEHLPRLGWDVVVGFARGKRFHDPSRFREVYRDLDGVDIDGRDGTVDGRLRAVAAVLASTSTPTTVLALARRVDSP